MLKYGIRVEEEKPVFAQLVAFKSVGLEVEIDKRTLEKLWADEMVCDKSIAELFGCSVEYIKYLRDKWGITYENSKKRAADMFRAMGNENLAMIMEL